MCYDEMGLPSKSQARVVQSPVTQCYITNNIFIPAVNVLDIARFFGRPLNGSYFCCDIHEQGYGYLFTDCGGSEVIILPEKLNDTTYKN